MIFIDDKTDILDRLDQNKKIGRGGGFGMKQLKGYTINNEISGGCHCGDEIKRGAGFDKKHLKSYIINQSKYYIYNIIYIRFILNNL